MKQIQIPTTKAQKRFEDLATTLLKTAAQLDEERQNDLLEYAMKLAYEDKHKND